MSTYKHDRIRAAKPCEDKPGYLVACETDDPEANHFTVAYPNDYQVTLEFDNAYRAHEVARALDAAVEYGKKKQLEELRRYLGIK